MVDEAVYFLGKDYSGLVATLDLQVVFSGLGLGAVSFVSM